MISFVGIRQALFGAFKFKQTDPGSHSISCAFVDADTSVKHRICNHPETHRNGALDADDTHMVSHTGSEEVSRR
jgi:hypothetical protein